MYMYGEFYGKRDACANSVHQVLKGPGDEATARGTHSLLPTLVHN